MGLWSTWVVCRSFPYFVIVWLSEFDGNLGRSKGKLLVSTTGCRRMDWPGQLIFQSSVWSWRHQTNARPLMEYRLGVDDTPRINRMQLSHRYQLAIAWLGFLLRASWSKDSLMIDNWSGTEEKREKRREKEEKTEREKREREREGEQKNLFHWFWFDFLFLAGECSNRGDNDDEIASDNTRARCEQVGYFSRYEQQCERLAAQPRSICSSRFWQRCQQRSLEDTRRLSHLCRFPSQPFQFY